jgi:DNA-binding response OmpR family regulator
MKVKIILLESAAESTGKLYAELERNGFDVIFVSMDSIDEVLSRMYALTNQEKAKGKNCFMGNLLFIPEEHLLKYNGQEIQLRNNENILLKVLYDNGNRVVSKETLTVEIWNESDPKMKDHSLNNLIYTIREKLMIVPGIELKTIPKKGYKLSF